MRYALLFIFLMFSTNLLCMEKPPFTSYLQRIPREILYAQLPSYIASPGPKRDNKPDLVIEQSRDLDNYLAYIRFARISAVATVDESKIIDDRLAFYKTHPEEKSAFLPNALSIAASSQSKKFWNLFRSDSAQRAKFLETFKALPQPEKDKTTIDIIRRHPSPTIIAALIDAGASPDASDQDTAITLLRFAVDARKIDQKRRNRLISALLKRNAAPAKCDKFSCSPLMAAVSHADLDAAQLILEKDAQINSSNIFNDTALGLAARKGNLAMVNLLLSKGASIYICDEEQRKNVLVQAVIGGSLDVLRALMNARLPHNGVDFVFTSYVATALIKAAELGRNAIVEMFLDLNDVLKFQAHERRPNPDPYLTIDDNQSALSASLSGNHFDVALLLLNYAKDRHSSKVKSQSHSLAIAVRKSHSYEVEENPEKLSEIKEVIDELLQDGANPAIDALSPSACFVAADLGDLPLLEKMLECASKQEKNVPEKILHSAATAGKANAVRSVLHFKVDPNDKDSNGDYVLHKAVIMADADNCTMIEDLLAVGANPCMVDKNKNTVFHKILLNPSIVARYKILTSILHKLKEMNKTVAVINQKNSKGDTPLLMACDLPVSDGLMVDFLLANGADPNIANKNGDTALIKATDNNNVDAVDSLLKDGVHSVDVNAKNNSGCGALSKAARNGNNKITGMLIAKGARFAEFKDSMLREAAKGGHVKYMSKLLELNANIGGRSSSYGNTPLHKAVLKGEIETVKFLVGQKADRQAKNNLGQTPLELALLIQDYEIAEYLFDPESSS